MFQPTAAILAHSLVDLNSAVLSLLKPEDALLIHRVTARADRQRESRVNTAGREVLVVYTEEELLWDVQASLLDQVGLGDYHPGRALSATALAWANGADLPFQFKQGLGHEFIYEAPVLDMPAGDLPSLSFRIRALFAEFDTEEEPDTDAPGLNDFEEIPAQTAVELSTDIRQALLMEIFQGLNGFGTAPFTAALYEGDPTTGGVQHFGPVDLEPWTSFTNTAAYITKAQNHEVIEWTGVVDFPRTITHIRYTRGSYNWDVALAAPLTVPALSGVRAPINALALQLTWPWDVTGSAPSPLPSRNYLEYVVGGTREAAGIAGVLSVEFSDATLATDTDLIEGIPATNEHWEVSGLTVTPKDISGTADAPTGGWSSQVVAIYCGGVLAGRRYHNLFVQEGSKYYLHDQPVIDLEAAPA